MKLQIKPSDTIQIIQEKFQAVFSHLKIEFYTHAHHTSEGSAKNEQYLHNITLKEIIKSDLAIEIDIDATMSTAAFEQYFLETYQISIQVMRKQRGTWLQTTKSDSLSLEAQNQKGIQADIDIELESPSEIDYD